MSTITTELLKAWEITPAGITGIDSLYILDDGHWPHLFSRIENALESQLENPWDSMNVTVKACYITPEFWDEIQQD